jgi:hypothetical protein
MRRSRGRAQIGAKMKLCRKENDGQNEGQDGYSRCAVMHVLSKTELREEWLRGQGLAGRVRSLQPNCVTVRLSCYTEVCSGRYMDCAKFISGKRALAILGCIALLYFAAGGAFVHQHTGGPETACHVCQSLHVPALAAASQDLIPEARQVAWHAVVPENQAPLDSFSLHRASRAPPVA